MTRSVDFLLLIPRKTVAQAWKPYLNIGKIENYCVYIRTWTELVMSDFSPGQFPKIRLRRTRRTTALRRLVAESSLDASDFIYPVFVLDGENRTEAVPSMPGIERKSVDKLLRELETAVDLGIPAVALFPVIDADK
jgi:hypothetical protein